MPHSTMNAAKTQADSPIEADPLRTPRKGEKCRRTNGIKKMPPRLPVTDDGSDQFRFCHQKTVDVWQSIRPELQQLEDGLHERLYPAAFEAARTFLNHR